MEVEHENRRIFIERGGNLLYQKKFFFLLSAIKFLHSYKNRPLNWK